jgi:hypothetical protein
MDDHVGESTLPFDMDRRHARDLLFLPGAHVDQPQLAPLLGDKG